MILKKEKKEKEKVRDGPGICLVPPTSLPIHPLFFWSFFLVFYLGGLSGKNVRDLGVK